jgi:hypothetical protein
MPFTVTTREGVSFFAKGLLPPAFAPALSLTPPQCESSRTELSCRALQAHGAVTRGSVIARECKHLYNSLDSRAWG